MDIFKPLQNREPISKLIASQIEDAILSNKYPPGSKIPSEMKLCEQFKVSRTSLREALKTLAAQGLITVYKGKGIFVNELSSGNVSGSIQKYLKQKLGRNYAFDIVRARQILEPAIAYSASLNRNEEDLRNIESNIRELESSDANFEQLAHIDMGFHLLLAKASQNSVVPLLLKSIYKLVPEINSTVYATIEDARSSAVIWHRKIYELIKNRDAGAATIAMADHLKIAEAHTEKMLISTGIGE